MILARVKLILFRIKNYPFWNLSIFFFVKMLGSNDQAFKNASFADEKSPSFLRILAFKK